MTQSFGKKYFVFLLIFLGALSAFGPFITDFYLPTLPAMADIFNTSASMVQLGLTASLLGIALGQVFFGPLSDKYGRLPIMVWSLVLFAMSTVGCIYSPSIEMFDIFRFLQGLGGAGGIVMSRSVATDCYSGRELAKVLAIVGAINGIAPVVAPVTGGIVAQSLGWQGIFWVLFAIGVVLMGMCVPFRESLPKENRVNGSVWKAAHGFVDVFKIPEFRRYVAVFGLAYGVLFTYISSASFIVQDHFGYSEIQFSLTFGTNAIIIAIGSGLAMKFKNMENAALFSTAGMTIFSILLLISYFFTDSFLVYEGLTIISLFFLGFIFPSVTALGMESGRKAVGAASAVLGAVGFACGGLVSPLVGIGDLMLTTYILLVVCSGFATVLCLGKS
ncbi:MAG: multidrug effflux MFS transporter [Muribaculaceae bacterium]|nr:multidrug effflux MFS transporter [Muribaculaceae bacterium]